MKFSKLFNLVIVFALLLASFQFTTAPTTAHAAQAPSLIITEVVPNSGDSGSNYSYTEIYNASDEEIDLTGYSIKYFFGTIANFNKYPGSDVYFTDATKINTWPIVMDTSSTDIKIKPKQTKVIWVKKQNGKGWNTPLSEFQKNYGLAEGELTGAQMLALNNTGTDGFSGTSFRSVGVADPSGKLISVAVYNKGASATLDVSSKESVQYTYPSAGGFILTQTATHKTPTPGRLPIDEVLNPSVKWDLHSADISWTEPDHLTSSAEYKFVNIYNANGIKAAGPIAKGTTTARVNGLSSGTDYTFNIKTMSADEVYESFGTQTPPGRTIRLDGLPPAQVPQISAEIVEDSIRLKWVASSEEDLAGYRIKAYHYDRSTNQNIPLSGQPYDYEAAASETSLIIKHDFIGGELYKFAVMAYDLEGLTSAPSELGSIEFENKPTGLKAVEGNGTVLLSWNPLLLPLLGYRVYVNDVPVNSDAVTVNGSVYDYQVAGLTNGTKYKFTVTGVFDSKETLPSEPVYATPVVLESIDVSPLSSKLWLGGLYSLSVTANYSGASHVDVTNAAAFSSSDDKVVKIDEMGSITALTVGKAVITILYGGKTAVVPVEVVIKTSSSVPSLLVTEVVPNSGDSGSNYSYTEIYNASDEEIDLTGYSIKYFFGTIANFNKYPGSDVYFTDASKINTWPIVMDTSGTDAKIKPKQTKVIWVKKQNGKGWNAPLSEFRNNYGLAEGELNGVQMLALNNAGTDGFNGTSFRSVGIADPSGKLISVAVYNKGASATLDVLNKESIQYTYPTDGGFIMTQTGTHMKPTPGRLPIAEVVNPKARWGKTTALISWTEAGPLTAAEEYQYVNIYDQNGNLMEGKIPKGNTAVRFNGLSENKEYQFLIKTMTADQVYESMGVATPPGREIVIDGSPPSKPQQVSVQNEGDAIRLSWASNSEPDMANYRVKVYHFDRSSNLNKPISNLEFDYEVNASQTSIMVNKNLIVGEIYKFAVTAVDLEELSSQASELATILYDPKPNKLKATVGDQSQTVSLSWDPLLTPLLGYRVYMNDVPVTASTYTVNNSVYAYKVTGLTNGSTYKFTVTGVTYNKETTPSDPVYAKPYFLEGISVNGLSSTIRTNSSWNVSVTANYLGMDNVDVTSQSKFSSSNASIATIDALGKVTALNVVGDTTITAAYGGKTASMQVSVIRSSNHSSGSSGGGGSASGGSTANTSPNITAEKPASVEYITRKETSSSGNPMAILDVNGSQLKEAFTWLDAQNHTITISYSGSEAAVKMTVPAAIWMDGLTRKPNAAMILKTNQVTYELPLRALNYQELMKNLGGSISDMSISIQIEKLTGSSEEKSRELVQSHGAKWLGTAYQFTVWVESGMGKLEVNPFDGVYAVRTIEMDGEADAASAAVLDLSSGQMKFVPSYFEKRDGKTIVTIKRQGNSVYGIIQATRTFDDVQGHWAQADIEQMASKLLFDGIFKDTFHPDQAITRAEFAAILVRSLGLVPNQTTGLKFKDVKNSDWFFDSVQLASQSGLIEGDDNLQFYPNDQITRQEMAVMMSRALHMSEASLAQVTSNSFRDNINISDWALKSVDEMVSTGIIQGMDDNRFAPVANATRAQTITMTKRLLQYLQFIN
ncbi:fibronectin type III domain-containing protein [Paenibacillus foliorum]|uniref:fibronectin type III domain-containing protein n=1 Tax=Paenibacillus foliorum TaxID=2654974 RepID=UPI0014912BE1|nr:S-layer homology domain-containing protein [Paenibacillus foliorum]